MVIMLWQNAVRNFVSRHELNAEESSTTPSTVSTDAPGLLREERQCKAVFPVILLFKVLQLHCRWSSGRREDGLAAAACSITENA